MSLEREEICLPVFSFVLSFSATSPWSCVFWDDSRWCLRVSVWVSTMMMRRGCVIVQRLGLGVEDIYVGVWSWVEFAWICFSLLSLFLILLLTELQYTV